MQMRRENVFLALMLAGMVFLPEMAMAQTRASLGRIDVEEIQVTADINPRTQSITGKARVRFLAVDDKISTATFEQVLRVNVMGTFFATREALKRLSTRYGGTGGCIINVSSGTAISGGPGAYVHYAATKGALDTMTAGLSKELGPEGIRVNTVRPGAILTDMQKDRPAEQLERIGKGVPLGRLGTPQDIAETIVWLASPAAAYINGAFIDVRGG